MERISDLMDGELDPQQAQLELDRLKRDPQARASWDTFHLIGAAMRGERTVSPALARRVSERLGKEPTVQAYSPGTAIQGLAPYFRTVSGIQPASERREQQ